MASTFGSDPRNSTQAKPAEPLCQLSRCQCARWQIFRFGDAFRVWDHRSAECSSKLIDCNGRVCWSAVAIGANDEVGSLASVLSCVADGLCPLFSRGCVACWRGVQGVRIQGRLGSVRSANDGAVLYTGWMVLMMMAAWFGYL